MVGSVEPRVMEPLLGDVVSGLGPRTIPSPVVAAGSLESPLPPPHPLSAPAIKKTLANKTPEPSPLLDMSTPARFRKPIAWRNASGSAESGTHGGCKTKAGLTGRRHSRDPLAQMIPATPLSWARKPLDRKLCAPSFRWVCPCRIGPATRRRASRTDCLYKLMRNV